MVNIEALSKALLEAVKNGNLEEVQSLLSTKELTEEMIASDNNKILKAAILNCPLPAVARFEKTQHAEIVEKLMHIQAVRLSLQNERDLFNYDEVMNALEGANANKIIQIIKENALIKAATQGNLEEIIRLLKTLKAANPAAKAASKAAAKAGHLEILRAILREVETHDLAFVLDSKGPLLEAADTGHLEIVEYLLGKEEIIKTLAEFGDCFDVACSKNHIAIVHRFLRERVMQEYAAAFNNNKLRNAVTNRQFALADRLLQEVTVRRQIHVSSLPNHANQNEAFNEAISKDAVALLYRIALEYSRSNEWGSVEMSPWLSHIESIPALQPMLRNHGFEDLATFMREFPARIKERYDNLQRTSFELIEQPGIDHPMIDCVYINLKPYYLQWAAEYGHVEILKQCLAEDLDESFLDMNYYRLRTLQLAANNGHLDVIHLLLQRAEFQRSLAMDPNSVLLRAIINKHTPFSVRGTPQAMLDAHLPIVERLLQEKIVKESLAPDMIVFAVKIGSLAIFDRLLQEEVICNNITANHNKAMATAAEHGNLTMVRRLIKIPQVQSHPTLLGVADLLGGIGLFGYLEVFDLILQMEAVRSAIMENDYAMLKIAIQNAVLITDNPPFLKQRKNVPTLNVALGIVYRLLHEYLKQRGNLPEEILNSENFITLMGKNNYSDVNTFLREYPIRMKLEQDKLKAMTEHLVEYLPEAVANLALEYGEPPTIDTYRILQPYFQAHINRDTLFQQIRQGARLKGAKFPGGSAAA